MAGEAMEVEAETPTDTTQTTKDEPMEPRPDEKSLSVKPPNPIPEGDMYAAFKRAEDERDFLDVQEQYVKDEIKNLKRELIRAKEEIKRIQSVPLVIGQFNEMVDATYGIASSTAGSVYYVRVLSTLDREKLKPNSSVALHRHSHSVVDVLPPESDSTIQLMIEKPKITYKDIGGLDVQKQEMREAVELPLTQFELYKQIGIDPPRGVLMYRGPERTSCYIPWTGSRRRRGCYMDRPWTGSRRCRPAVSIPSTPRALRRPSRSRRPFDSAPASGAGDPSAEGSGGSATGLRAQPWTRAWAWTRARTRAWAWARAWARAWAWTGA